MRSKISDDVYKADGDLQMSTARPAGDFDQLLNDDSALLDFMVSNNDFQTRYPSNLHTASLSSRLTTRDETL